MTDEDQNPFQSPVAGRSEPPPEPLRTAALRGAKRGAMIGVAFPLAIVVIEMAILGYFWLTDADMFAHILNGKSLWHELFESAWQTGVLGLIGALGGAALLAARAHGRAHRLAKSKPD